MDLEESRDMKVAMRLVELIANPASDPRKKYESHNLRKDHLRLAKGVLKGMEDSAAIGYVQGAIGMYETRASDL